MSDLNYDDYDFQYHTDEVLREIPYLPLSKLTSIFKDVSENDYLRRFHNSKFERLRESLAEHIAKRKHDARQDLVVLTLVQIAHSAARHLPDMALNVQRCASALEFLVSESNEMRAALSELVSSSENIRYLMEDMEHRGSNSEILQVLHTLSEHPVAGDTVPEMLGDIRGFLEARDRHRR